MSPHKFEDVFYELNGVLYWQINISKFKKTKDQPITNTDSKGYKRVGYKGKSYYVHKIIFYLHTGLWPNFVDHKNRDISNNKFENLRDATISQNAGNQGLARNNSSGYKGVCFHKQSGKFLSRIMYEGKRFTLGLFTTAEEAAKEYDLAALELFGEFAYTNFKEN